MTRSSTPTGRSLALAATLVAASTAAPAHTYVLALGDSAAATHYFGVICSTDGGNDSDQLFMQIESHAVAGPLVSAQIIKGSVATSTTDPIGGDAQPSPAMRVRGGNGLYQVLVHKAAAGAVSFTVTVHCLDATGTQHTGTDAVVYQYQDR
jgi:hypothetical protein